MVRGKWICCVPCLDARDGFDVVFTTLLQWSVNSTLCAGSTGVGSQPYDKP